MNWWKRLPERVRTVIIWAPIPLFMVIASPWSAWIIFTILAVIAVWEWRRIIFQTRKGFNTRATQLAIIAIAVSMLLAPFEAWFSVGLAIVASIALPFMEKSKFRLDVFLSQFVPSIVGLGAYFVRAEPNGLALLGLMLVITISSDTAAYFVGRAIGKNKFAPKISPNKTWEGAIGGWVFAILFAWIYASYFLPSIDSWAWYSKAMFFWLLALGGQMGDLGESAVKRKYGVKDSSDLFPGHGGVLDRFDSFAGVIAVMSIVGLFV